MLRQLIRMTESAAKRVKMNGSGPRIGTHNGHFHADEALAVYMLRQLPAYADASLVRTRDPELLKTCHTVVDVGGEYDASVHRYDHHQRTFDTTFPGRPTKLSSAGLVYMHFGRALVASRLNQPEDSDDVTAVWNKMYGSFIEALDAHDNGISAYDPKALEAAGIQKRFQTSGFNLGALVGRLNPNWNDELPSDPAAAQVAEDDRFLTASSRIGEEFASTLDYYVRSWLPARTIVADAYAKRFEHDTEGRVIVFEGGGVPWKDHLYTLEEAEAEGGDEKKAKQQVLYVLYPEKAVPGSKWRIQAVPVADGSFVSRKPLPEPWRGARDEQLDEACGVPGGVFVHASGFIGGNKTWEGAKEMAAKACAF